MLIAIQRNKHYRSKNVPTVWAECLQARGVDVRWVDLTGNDLLGQLEDCNGLMWHRGQKSQDKLESQRILHSIELYLGLPVFPNHNISWHYDEKMSVYYLLQAAGVPTPKTWVFWEKEKALEWARETDYPKVFKLSAGTGGLNVAKVRNSKEATKLIHRMFGPGIYGGQIGLDSNKRPYQWWKGPRAIVRRWKSALNYVISGNPPIIRGSWRQEKGYAYFQEFIPHEFETGVLVIGDTAWAVRAFSIPGDFRISGSLARGGERFDADPAAIDSRCIRMAFELSDRLGFESMKYDFFLKDGDPVLFELDYAVGRGRRIKRPGTWNRKLEWISGYKRPADAQVEVFLKRVKSKETASIADLPGRE